MFLALVMRLKTSRFAWVCSRESSAEGRNATHVVRAFERYFTFSHLRGISANVKPRPNCLILRGGLLQHTTNSVNPKASLFVVTSSDVSQSPLKRKTCRRQLQPAIEQRVASRSCLFFYERIRIEIRPCWSTVMSGRRNFGSSRFLL